jgi:sulfite reductase alpha subunit-like flavoprotein
MTGHEMLTSFPAFPCPGQLRTIAGKAVEHCSGVSCVQVLQDFPSVDIPLAWLLEAGPRLQPRQFSLSSSPLAHPGKAHITVAVVDYRTPYKRRVTGLCSSWLSELTPGCFPPSFWPFKRACTELHQC